MPSAPRLRAAPPTRWLWLAAYISTIFAANWAITTFGVVPVGFGLMAPAGVYFAGLAFTLRDVVQEHCGRRWAVAAIVVGAILSAWVSPRFAVASGVAFLASEFADFAVYAPLRQHGWLWAVSVSNLVGLVIDSMLFLGLAFGAWTYLPGQLVGKAWMTLLAVTIFGLLRRPAPAQ